MTATKNKKLKIINKKQNKKNKKNTNAKNSIKQNHEK